MDGLYRGGRVKNPKRDLGGCRVLIVCGQHAGQEGICLGPSADRKKWSASPDESNEILSLTFEKEFGLVLDMSGDVQTN
jgi:hypothetical protein